MLIIILDEIRSIVVLLDTIYVMKKEIRINSMSDERYIFCERYHYIVR